MTLARKRLFGLVLLAAAGLLAQGCDGALEEGVAGPRIAVHETKELPLDRLYASMAGPYDTIEFDYTGLDWVTGIRADPVDAETGEILGEEFICHAQLQLPNSTRLMVTAPGVNAVRFPEGFGMPVRKILDGLPAYDRQLTLLGMLLNTQVAEIDRKVKVRWTIEYWKDEDEAAADLTSLYKTTLSMTVEDLELFDGPVPDDPGARCVLVGGRNIHWLVPPGPQTTRRRFTNFMPVESTVHFAAVHLHNYGVYMRLNDVTTGEMLWQTDAEYDEDHLHIKSQPAYSSTEGFTMYPDHEYEIEAYYDNTTRADIDAMAMMYIFYHPSNNEVITYPVAPGELL